MRAQESQAADARRAIWDKKVADFDDSLKEEPGVKKFGKKIQATFGPGETLVASGWRTAGGKNGLLFVTPQMNPELEGAGVISNQVWIASRLIEAPDEVLDRLGMASFKAQPQGANAPVKFPSGQADAMVNSITNAAGSDSVFSPKVGPLFGHEASIMLGTEALISGKQQPLGFQTIFFPSRSADGNSLDIGMLVRYTVSTVAEDAPAENQ
jgi:hypothetical protein